MKILHIIDYHPKYHTIYGGAEISTLRLVKELNKIGHENFLMITFPNKNIEIEKNIFPLKTIYDYIDFKNPKSIKNRILSIIDFYKNIFPFDILIFFKSIKVLKKLQPDVIHFHNFKKLSFSILLVAKFFKIKSLLSIYDYWFFCPNETLINNNKKICKSYNSFKCFKCFKCFNISLKFRIFLPLRRYFFNFFIKRIDGFIFLSYSSLKIGKDYGIPDKKSKVIPQIFENFIEEEYTIPQQNIVLYVGWIQYRKGLHILIEAFEEIVKEFRDVKLYIIGEIEQVEEKYVKEILKKIKERGIKRNVEIVGKLPQEKVKEYMKKAKIVVIPEQWENMSPVVLVEAMFLKKAIVASRIGGIPEFIEDGKEGFLCEPQNISQFSKKILILLKDSKLVENFGRNAYEKAKKVWNNEKNIRDIVEFYKKVKNE